MEKKYIDNNLVYKFRSKQLYDETVNNLKSLHNDKFIETRKALECQKHKCDEKGKHNECDNKTLDNRLSYLLHKPVSKIKETFAICIGNREEYYSYKKGNLLGESYDNDSFQDDDNCFKCTKVDKIIVLKSKIIIYERVL